MELTEKQKEFIGSKFPTRKGGELEVIGYHKENKNYLLICSLCSQDEELFPEPFQSKKSKLLQGKLPCGCSKRTMWKKSQYEVLIKRECETCNYIFHGFYGEWLGDRTYLDL